MNKLKNMLKSNDLIIKTVCYTSRVLNCVIMFNMFSSYGNILKFNALTFFKNVKTNIKGKNNEIISSGRVTLRNVKIEIIGNNNQLLIKDGVKFYEGAKILIEGDNCNIIIGHKSTFGSVSLFCTESNTSIFIGDDCMFGREIKVLTGDFHSIIDLNTGKRINYSKDIIIGDHVWIGYHSSVSKGAKISNNTVVASYSLVNKQFDETNVVLAGSPAKIIKSNIDWSRKKLA